VVKPPFSGMNSICIISIAGYSGSGKTTLIRKMLPELKKQGLSVGILKHIHHKLNIDIKGKDTDHFYRAGADFVFAHDAGQGFARFRSDNDNFSGLLKRLPPALDLLIVEGHKDLEAPGVWLEARAAGPRVVSSGPGGRKVVSRDDPNYHLKALALIRNELEKIHSERNVKAGLLIGGKSTRMGMPKTLLKVKGRTLAFRSFDILSFVSEKTVLLGSGQIPKSLNSADRLPDVPNVHGPLAGMLSAFRWSPHSAWIISSVDMPLMHKDAWEWLLSQRRPGVWAVLPKIRGSKGVETTGAVYEPMIFEYAESLSASGNTKLQEIARHPKVMAPLIPEALARAWRNINTPTEWSKVRDLDAWQN
jgi:molybdopterin-guanine dinucleotide biosynthesis protein MobB